MNGESVYLFRPWTGRPKYHDYGSIKDLNGFGITGDVTKCGLVMYDGQVRYHALLRRDQADLFADPCRRCFREGE